MRTHAVAGHLVVLDVLSRGDESGIEDFGLRALLDELGAFLEDALHAVALLAARALAELAADRSSRLTCWRVCLLVLGEAALEIRVSRGPDHLGQRLENLLLGAVQVLELGSRIDRERFHFH